MKQYKKIELEAVNAPSGSYAAGCPQYHAGTGTDTNTGTPGNQNNSCRFCECTK